MWTATRLLEESLIDNAAKMGKYIMTGLRRMQKKSRHLGRLSGKGLMIGMEVVKDRRTMKPAPGVRDRIVEVCFRKGLLVLPCGPTSVRFVPPLVIGRQEADIALEIFGGALSKVGKGR
ncbi:MAG: aminotransferase class III-fold pyridoxal phosphate-dependent enzyme [Candidatus Eisenbacteria bacterium]